MSLFGSSKSLDKASVRSILNENESVGSEDVEIEHHSFHGTDDEIIHAIIRHAICVIAGIRCRDSSDKECWIKRVKELCARHIAPKES